MVSGELQVLALGTSSLDAHDLEQTGPLVVSPSRQIGDEGQDRRQPVKRAPFAERQRTDIDPQGGGDPFRRRVAKGRRAFPTGREGLAYFGAEVANLEAVPI